MRDQMQEGDGVLFYASNADPSGVTGLAEIVRAGLSGPHGLAEGAQGTSIPATKKDAPSWFMVDIGFVERFPGVVSLETLKATKGLESMMVTQKGSRLSVQPVTKAEYEHRRAPGRQRPASQRLTQALSRISAIRSPRNEPAHSSSPTWIATVAARDHRAGRVVHDGRVGPLVRIHPADRRRGDAVARPGGAARAEHGAVGPALAGHEQRAVGRPPHVVHAEAQASACRARPASGRARRA